MSNEIKAIRPFNDRRKYSVDVILNDCDNRVFRRTGNVVDHAGKRFGSLVVVRYAGRRPTPSNPKCGNALWHCRCDCGLDTVVVARSLVDGSTKSCGCKAIELLRAKGGWNAKENGESAFNQYLGGYKRSAAARGYEFNLSDNEFREIIGQPCFYCGALPLNPVACVKGTRGDYIANGVDRADNGLGYVIGNVRPCCKQCNIAKGILTEAAFRSWAKRVVEHGESGAA